MVTRSTASGKISSSVPGETFSITKRSIAGIRRGTRVYRHYQMVAIVLTFALMVFGGILVPTAPVMTLPELTTMQPLRSLGSLLGSTIFRTERSTWSHILTFFAGMVVATALCVPRKVRMGMTERRWLLYRQCLSRIGWVRLLILYTALILVIAALAKHLPQVFTTRQGSIAQQCGSYNYSNTCYIYQADKRGYDIYYRDHNGAMWQLRSFAPLSSFPKWEQP